MLFEIETLPGLERFAAAEVKQTCGLTPRQHRIDHRGHLGPLLSLRTAVAVHRYERFEGRRPTVILGDQRFRTMIMYVVAQARFTGFRISCPGSESTALRRLRDSVAEWTGLPEGPHGDLLIRIRRDQDAWR